MVRQPLDVGTRVRCTPSVGPPVDGVITAVIDVFCDCPDPGHRYLYVVEHPGRPREGLYCSAEIETLH
jgi:hypothetical protein